MGTVMEIVDQRGIDHATKFDPGAKRGRDHGYPAIRALGEGGAELRWEPFFFDWFCADEARALAGPRASLYGGEAFGEFRERLKAHAPERPERLDHGYFARPEPEEMLIDEVERIWSAVSEADDWSLFNAKVDRLRAAGTAWALT